MASSGFGLASRGTGFNEIKTPDIGLAVLMFDPDQLAALAAVHRRGSFDLAAAELHVTPSAISQRI
jgi:hypothetical protein